MTQIAEVLYHANTMSSDEYLTYCDTLESIDGEVHDFYSSVDEFEKKNNVILALSGFFYPEQIKFENGHLLGFQMHDGFMEIYDIFAINRNTGKIWCYHVFEYPTEDPFVETSLLEAIIPEIKKWIQVNLAMYLNDDIDVES